MAREVEVRYLLQTPGGALEECSARGEVETADLALFTRPDSGLPLLDLTVPLAEEYRLVTKGGQEPRLEPVLKRNGFAEPLSVVGAVSFERMRRMLLDQSKEMMLPELARERRKWLAQG